jgi:FAD/FMN-containing dehydrogenase
MKPNTQYLRIFSGQTPVISPLCMNRWFKILLRFLVYPLLFIVLIITVTFFVVTAPPEEIITKEQVVSDVTQLNPITVNQVHKPQTVEQIIALVKDHQGPVSIGGARHSMGGQIGTENALHLDMREFDEIIEFSNERREITVQTGITWRKIQEHIDPHGLSIQIMQTYANFTVGGSLSVNVHGRYIGQGPIIYAVRSIKVVLADGSLVSASPDQHPEIFYGCIGGYGGLGVIAEATIELTDNVKVARKNQVMTVEEYNEYFTKNIRNDSLVVFHNADIYPDDYREVRAISYVKTDKPVTIEHRLKPLDENYRAERFGMWVVSEMPFGKWVRQHWGDPLYYKSESVRWRNYEASYDANELEPSSRKHATYVLQEYFVPTGKFDVFVPAMAKIFQQHDVNVINVSIRHAHKDPGSLLAWATDEMFCFVVYYKQGTTEAERKSVGVWTRELIDAAIAVNGSYYLPYQIHATKEQFRKAYPRTSEFFALKKRIDPTNKFRNKLWDAYYEITQDTIQNAPIVVSSDVALGESTQRHR